MSSFFVCIPLREVGDSTLTDRQIGIPEDMLKVVPPARVRRPLTHPTWAHMAKLPIVLKTKYNESMVGVAGEIGAGRYGVRYLQGAIPIAEIDRLTLVSELPDSERWHVRQLFQRDIDKKRVLEEIMPYFKHAQKIKFFNPLTIVLMPMDGLGHVLEGVNEKQLPPVVEGELSLQVFEAEGHYKLAWPDKSYPYGTVDYNSQTVTLVAVDGQHRLSALKRLRRQHLSAQADPAFAKIRFDNWRIPIVVLIFPPLETAGAVPDQHVLLENVRDIFVTINTNAQRPNRCREILLNDDSVTAICCQELLDYCHQDGGQLPLLFFDWRAHDREDNIYPENRQAFLRVEELEDFHIEYLLGGSEGSDFLTQKQRDALFFDSMTPSVDENDRGKLRDAVRRRYPGETLMPALVHVFATFKPFALYVEFLKQLRAGLDTDIKVHAMSELLYGVHHAPEELDQPINQMIAGMIKQCETKRKEIPSYSRISLAAGLLFAGLP